MHVGLQVFKGLATFTQKGLDLWCCGPCLPVKHLLALLVVTLAEFLPLHPLAEILHYPIEGGGHFFELGDVAAKLI